MFTDTKMAICSGTAQHLTFAIDVPVAVVTNIVGMKGMFKLLKENAGQ